MRIFNNINDCYEVFLVYNLKQVNKIGSDIKFVFGQKLFFWVQVSTK